MRRITAYIMALAAGYTQTRTIARAYHRALRTHLPQVVRVGGKRVTVWPTGRVAFGEADTSGG